MKRLMPLSSPLLLALASGVLAQTPQTPQTPILVRDIAPGPPEVIGGANPRGFAAEHYVPRQNTAELGNRMFFIGLDNRLCSTRGTRASTQPLTGEAYTGWYHWICDLSKPATKKVSSSLRRPWPSRRVREWR